MFIYTKVVVVVVVIFFLGGEGETLVPTGVSKLEAIIFVLDAFEQKGSLGITTIIRLSFSTSKGKVEKRVIGY